MRIQALLFVALATPSLLSSLPRAQNDLVLNNGIEVLFIYSDPSQGFPTGTLPPDLDGDWFWKVYPREALLSPTGVLTLSGMGIYLFDTDWSTPPPYYDTLITRGTASPTLPGSIEPDFSDPEAIFISMGQSALPDPCSVDPTLCPGGACPPVGFVLGWEVEIAFGSGGGSPLQLRADGQHDYAVVDFVPGGMGFSAGPPGACGLGDYALQDAASTDESQANVLGGYSAYGGFHIGGGGFQPFANSVTDGTWHVLEFVEPIAQPRVDPGTNQPELGLAGLRLDVGSGLAKYGYAVYDYASIGNTVIATASVLPPLAPPGIPFLGAQLLLDPADPALLRFRKTGAVQAVDHSYGPPPQPTVDDGVFQSSLVSVSAAAAGITLSSQAMVLDASGTSAHATQVFSTRLYP